jgi:flagellar biosynthesis/type III secretory pathway protein FliH
VEDLAAALEELKKILAEKEKIHAAEMEEVKRSVEASVRREAAAAVDRLTGAAEAVVAERRALLAGAEETVVRIALALAERIVKDRVEIDEETVLRTVREALALAADRREVVLRVHPDDLTLVKEHRPEWLEKLSEADNLRVEGDGRVRRGGCLVETETGDVDGRIDRQLKTMARTLIEKAR